MSEPTRKHGHRVLNKQKAALTIDKEVNNQEINIDINKFDRIEDDEIHASKFIDYNSDTPYYDLRGGFNSAIKIYRELCEKVPTFKTKVDKAGWSLFFKINVEKVSHRLIEALVERWWDTTHTFHFPFGELGFMPCDWSMLTRINIGTGTSIPYDASKYTFSYVKHNIFPEIDEKSWVSNAIRLSFLKYYFTDKYYLSNVLHDEIHVNRIVRAYFMFFLGQVFFSNAESYIQVGWLAAFEDLSLVGDYDWGSAAFSYLYMSLDNASRRKVKSLNGAWQVLQYWCYEYLGVGTPNYENNNRIRPRAARWNKDELQKNKMDISKFNLMVVRRMIEGLTVESVNWYPWAKCRTFDIKEQLAYRISYTRMIFFYDEDNGVWYLGDRCWRQFSEPYEINYLFVIPGCLPITSMSGITKNKGDPSMRYGCFEAKKLIQLVSHDTYKKYWAHVTNNGSRSKVDWDVTVYKASGDLSTITIPSPAEHATIPSPQELSYNQLYQAYQESRDLIAQMKKIILNETKDLSCIIKEKDDRIKELELQMAQSLLLNLNPLICSSQRNSSPSQLEATQSQLTLQILSLAALWFPIRSWSERAKHIWNLLPNVVRFLRPHVLTCPSSSLAEVCPNLPKLPSDINSVSYQLWIETHMQDDHFLLLNDILLFMFREAAWPPRPPTTRAILGDDIVIGDVRVVERYRELMSQLIVKISLEKSLVLSVGALGFAKWFFVHGVTKDFSPVTGIAALSGLLALLYEEVQPDTEA